MIEWIQTVAQWLTVWHTTRAAGLTAFVLVFLAVALGMVRSFPGLSATVKERLHSVHQAFGFAGVLMGLVHGLVLIHDSYVGYTWADILVPFADGRETIPMAAGILSLYGLMILQLTSDGLQKVGPKVWRAVHWLAYPAYLMGLYHGLAMGSDRAQPLVFGIYLGSIAILGLLLALRLLILAIKGKEANYANPAGRG